jgi:hypothetical protein
MKNYRVTIRLNVESDAPSSKQLSQDIHKGLERRLPDEFQIASVTAYEDVLLKDAA